MDSVHDIANYLLALAEADGEQLTHLKLQKLLYYAQGFSLALDGEPLFAEPILAWEHGPVVRAVYTKYRDSGSSPIAADEEFDSESLHSDTRVLLDEVYQVYGQFTAWRLRNMTHDEPPWLETPQNQEITHEAMRRYFETRVTG